jgi:hypothetical protein
MRVLFTGIPGVDLKRSVENIRTFIIESSDYHGCLHRPLKAEEHFLDVLREAQPSFFPDRFERLPLATQMVYALGLPKPFLRRSWSTALQRLLDGEKCGHDEDVFLCAHTVFHHQWTREFFCPIDTDAIGKWEPDLVVTLIDDTENCLDRLRRPGQMFDAATYDYTGMKGFNNALSHMRLLFDWRAIEILEAERIALDIRVPHFCLAVKHPVETAASLIRRRHTPVFYISHPITEPRRGLARGDEKEFTEFVGMLGEICTRLRRGVTLIEPTAIDEFRLRRASVPDVSVAGGESTLYLPHHTRRWPVSANTMWAAPEPEEVNPLDPGAFFTAVQLDKFVKAKTDGAGGDLPRDLLLVDVASNLLGVLVGNMTAQIDARDHKLVEQSDGLCVLRPVYLGNPSQGVEEEVKYFCQLCVSEGPRPVGLWIYTSQDDEFAYLCRRWIADYLAEALKKGTATGTGDPVTDGKIVTEVTSSLTYTADKSELAQRVLDSLGKRGIRMVGQYSGKVLDSRPERAVADARIQFIQAVESARPPYLEHLQDYASLQPGLVYKIREGPGISLGEFIRELLESAATSFGERTKRGEA